MRSLRQPRARHSTNARISRLNQYRKPFHTTVGNSADSQGTLGSRRWRRSTNEYGGADIREHTETHFNLDRREACKWPSHRSRTRSKAPSRSTCSSRVELLRSVSLVPKCLSHDPGSGALPLGRTGQARSGTRGLQQSEVTTNVFLLSCAILDAVD